MQSHFAQLRGIYQWRLSREGHQAVANFMNDDAVVVKILRSIDSANRVTGKSA